MVRKRKTAVKHVVTYKIAIHNPHQSGIGSHFMGYIYSLTKPNWDNTDFFDDTNKEWAVNEHSPKYITHVKDAKVERR